LRDLARLTLRALRPGSALHPRRALRAGWPGVTLRARGPRVAGRALRPLRPLRPIGTRRPLETLRPAVADRSERALRALRASAAGRPGGPLHADRTDRTALAGLARRAGWAIRAGGPCKPPGASIQPGTGGCMFPTPTKIQKSPLPQSGEVPE